MQHYNHVSGFDQTVNIVYIQRGAGWHNSLRENEFLALELRHEREIDNEQVSTYLQLPRLRLHFLRPGDGFGLHIEADSG